MAKCNIDTSGFITNRVLSGTRLTEAATDTQTRRGRRKTKEDEGGRGRTREDEGGRGRTREDEEDEGGRRRRVRTKDEGGWRNRYFWHIFLCDCRRFRNYMRKLEMDLKTHLTSTIPSWAVECRILALLLHSSLSDATRALGIVPGLPNSDSLAFENTAYIIIIVVFVFYLRIIYGEKLITEKHEKDIEDHI